VYRKRRIVKKTNTLLEMIVHSKKTAEIIEGAGFGWLLDFTLETVLHVSDFPVLEEIPARLLLLLTCAPLSLLGLYLKLPKEVLFVRVLRLLANLIY
jgi:hypothetical protein